MKEKYMENKGKWLEKLKDSRGRKNINFDIEKSALLIIDMQNYFLDKKSHAYVPASEEIFENVIALSNLFENVIKTRHIDSIEENNCMLKWWGKRIDREFAEIDPRIKKGIMIEKNRYSAFFNTNLNEILEKMNVRRVYISGLLTNLCCESTARDAFCYNYDVYLICDATCTYKEEYHFATLLNLSHGFAKIVATEEVLKNEKCF
ncbi:MAG: isochorismatase family protein [Thermoplasmatales archaeon]|nr:isochorismatase family protein [Thermoplasmatales archaeon]